MGGNTGVIWIVETDNDLAHVLETGPTPPYIVILKREHYTRKNILDFKNRLDRVAGVVFLDLDHDDSKLRSIPFSPEDRCPNRYSGLYANDSKYGDCKQNLWIPESQISGLLYDDIPFPIFLIKEKKSVDDIESCFKDYNIIKNDDKSMRKQNAYPLCSMQLDSFMLATKDTSTCLNSRSLMDEFFQSSGQRCYTVENQNIFAYYKTALGKFKPFDTSSKYLVPPLVEPQSVVLLIAKLSSLSMFTDISPGADSTITSIVTILAVAEALGKHLNDTEVVSSNRNIAFAFLDSEPYDYTGSSRMVYNMQNNTFPFMGLYRNTPTTFNADAMRNINLESLEYVIDLDQMASYPGADSIYLHSDPKSQDQDKLNKVASILREVADDEKVNFQHSDQQLPLPPSPIQEFLKRSENTKVEKRPFGLVLSNYDKTFSNLFYNSIYDDSHNIYKTSKEKLVEHISKVSSFIGKSVFKLAFDSSKPELKTNSELIGKLLDCYLIDADCVTFTKAWQAGQKLPKGGIQTYKDPTKLSDDMNGAITANLLAYFIGEKLDRKEYNLSRCLEENQKSFIYNFQYVNGNDEPIRDDKSGLCIRSQVNSIKATSPAFAITENGITVDGNYPAWTVSLNNIRNPARLFIKSSAVHQWCVFLIGLVLTLMAFITVHHIRAFIWRTKSDRDLVPATST